VFIILCCGHLPPLFGASLTDVVPSRAHSVLEGRKLNTGRRRDQTARLLKAFPAAGRMPKV
jgi:hypothetical protein